MHDAAVFQSNRNQAIRLPKAAEFPEGVKRVVVARLGAARLIAPAGQEWDSFFDGPPVSSDFLAERAQPETQERDGF